MATKPKLDKMPAPESTPTESTEDSPTVDQGPKTNDLGAFLPATYEVSPGIIREDR